MTHSSAVIILLVLGLASAAAASSSDDISNDEHHIHVANGLSTGKLLVVHCKLDKEDLGTHNLTAGSEFQWKLPDMWFEFPRYWCDLNTDDNRHVGFLPYDKEHYREREIDGETYWVARDDGVYVKVEDHLTFQYNLVYHWEQGGSPDPNVMV